MVAAIFGWKWLHPKTLADDVKEFGYAAFNGNRRWLFERRLDHQRYDVSPSQWESLDRNYFGPIFDGVEITRFPRAEIGNDGAIGVGFYEMSYQGKTMQEGINVYATDTGTRADFGSLFMQAWQVRAWKRGDTRHYFQVYVDAIDADQALLESYGFRGMYAPEPGDLQTWPKLRAHFAALATQYAKRP